jgi:PAS domain S-box-containing protein
MIVRDDLNPAQPRDIARVDAELVVPEFPAHEDPNTPSRRVGFLIRPLSVMLAVSFFLLAGWTAWGPEPGRVPYQVALACGIVFLMLRLILTRFELPLSSTNAVAGFAALIAIAYALAELWVAKSPWPTTQILIVILIAGFVLASRPWFTGLAIVSCVGWFAAGFPHLSEDSWVQMGGALLATVIWSGWFLELRLRSLTDFDRRVVKEEYNRVVEETRFFVRSTVSKRPEPWCQLCKASMDAVIRHDGERIIDANPSAGKLLGMDRSELENMPIANILAPEKREHMAATLRLGNFDPTETLVFRKDNTRVAVEMLNGGITLDPDGMLGMLLRDLSERDRSKEKVAAATARAQQMLRRQAELAILAGTPDTAENLDHILNMAVSAAHRWLPSTIGVFAVLWDNHTKGFTVAASSAQGRLATEKLASAEERNSIIGWLTTHNETLVMPNVGGDQFNVRVLYPYQSIEAFVALPLSGSAGVIGFMLVLENVAREFPPEDLEFLTILAHRSATACLQITLQEQVSYAGGGAF